MCSVMDVPSGWGTVTCLTKDVLDFVNLSEGGSPANTFLGSYMSFQRGQSFYLDSMGVTVFIWTEEGLTVWAPFQHQSISRFFCFFVTLLRTQLNANVKIWDLWAQWLLNFQQHSSGCDKGLPHFFKRTNAKTQRISKPFANELLIPSGQPTRFQISIQTSQPSLIGPLLPKYSTCSRDWAISKPVRIRCQWYQGISRHLLNVTFHTLFLKMLSFQSYPV